MRDAELKPAMIGVDESGSTEIAAHRVDLMIELLARPPFPSPRKAAGSPEI